MSAAGTSPPVRRNDPCPCGSGKKYKSCCAVRPKTGAAAAPSRTASSTPGIDDTLRRAHENADRGQIGAANQLYQEILSVEPEHADALWGLGRIMARRGELGRAIETVHRAVNAKGREARYHVTLAHLLLRIGRFDEAETALRTAIRLAPRTATAFAMLAELHDRRHESEKAREAASKALAIDPTNTNAGIILSIVQRRAGKASAARTRLEAIVRRERNPQQLRRAWSELGLILDEQGEPDEAYAAFERANAASAKSPVAGRIDASLPHRRIDAYRQAIESGDFPGPVATPDDARPPVVFLVGFPRSGTTMVEQLLGAHPGVVTMEERPALHTVRGALDPDDPDIGTPDALAQLDHDRVTALRAVYWDAVRSAIGGDVGGRTLVDKYPMNLIDAGLIDAVFPDARLLVVVRDPRDVCLSCLMQPFQLNSTNVNFLTLDATARLYEAVMDLWTSIREHLRIPVVEVRYEELVSQREPAARRMLERLGLEWDDAVLRFHEAARDRVIQTPSYAAVASPMTTRAVGRWQRYARHLEPAMPRLQRFVEAFGYDG